MNMKLKDDAYPNLDSIMVIGPTAVEVTTKSSGRFRIHAGEYLRGGDVDRYHAVYDELVKHHHGDVGDTAVGPHEVWTKTNMADAKGTTVEECIQQALAFVNNLELGRNTGPHKR
jgi:hypothetical protein